MRILTKVAGLALCLLSFFLWREGSEWAVWCYALAIFFFEESNYWDLRERIDK